MTIEPSVAPDPDPRQFRQRPAPGAAAAPGPVPEGLDWVSLLPSAAAPGFVYLAGACRGIAVGGGGRDLAEAGARLGGEAAEVLAQTAAPLPCADPGDRAIDAIWTGAPAPLRVAARSLATGRGVGVPAAAIFLSGCAVAERLPEAPPSSLGLAAGADRSAARLAGLLELIERDAAAGWWCEGARPHQLDAALAAGAAADVARLRSGAGEPRATGFLALASPTGVPVVCAISQDATGGGLAVGLKAALDPGAAAAGALLELLQMELALEMARHRAAREATAPGDRGPLARAALATADFAAFAGLPPQPAATDPGQDFDGMADRLARQGLAVTVADLPQPPGGLAVAKVFAPGLRPLPGRTRPAWPGTPGAHAPLM